MEEDRALLSSLGVTSANPEDIERDVLEQANNNRADISEAGGSTEEGLLERSKSHVTSSTSHGNLYNKLRAIEVEIDAVKSSLEFGQSSRYENDEKEAKNVEDEDTDRGSPNDLSLQHALAADRLKSLKKRKDQLEREMSGTAKDDRQDKLIRQIVSVDIKSKKKQPKGLPKRNKDQKRPSKIVSFREDDDFDAVLNAASAGFMETERDELVRKGILTPFHKLKGYERRIQDPSSSIRNNVLESLDRSDDFASSSIARAASSFSKAAQARPTTMLLDPEALPKLDPPAHPFQRLKAPLKISSSVDVDARRNKGLKRKNKRPLPARKLRKSSSCKENMSEENGEESSCHDEDYVEEDVAGVENVDCEEPTFVTLEGGLRIPETIFNQLFDYQKVGVQWLWELHCQRAGGIIGDEMGLGKTVQMVAFLGSLHFSNMYKPSIIVCPVTLLRQWKREIQKWYPGFHVEILHDSAIDASSRKKRVKHSSSDDESESTSDIEDENNLPSKVTKKWESLLNRVLDTESGLLITTYEQLRLQGDMLLDIDWGYAVLDEGHRIRNPNAEVTLVCKQLQTVHRIIMTGAPIQNKLTELWSLFDFVFPGKLGVMPVFEAEFAVPISVGGYANASPLQVSTAYRCAVVLRDLIMPYLLRRMKADVNAQLTKKAEHVLFCSLTAEQRSVYRAFLASSDVEQIFNGNRNSLYGIDIMRKICNHPDLLERDHASKYPDYGNPERSGKMKVVAQVLKVWKEQGHRALLFSQTQQMLDILQSFMIAGDYSYRRMDGSTPVKQRMDLIDEFNNSEDIFVFILTTKVGGLGTNLIGANRVIIFDPDWNPSTDMQARERAWRIGQTRDVTVFRLITRGTIEEKVYHRQIYKHFLTNKILKNPQQRRFFKARDMKDLFTLNDDVDGGSTETSNIFSQLSENVNALEAQDDNRNKPDSPQILAAAGPEDTGNGREDDAEGGLGENRTSLGDKKVDEETSILQSLFDAQGIHSAMNHDAIMNAHNEDGTKIDEQASQVAQRAAEALRQSRIIRSRENVAIPTWTGKSGAAGAPSSVRRKFGSTVNSQLLSNSRSSEDLSKGTDNRPNGVTAGPSSGRAMSSADLLARIRGNKESAVSQGLEQQFGLATSSNGRGRSVANGTSSSSTNASVQPEVLIRQLCTFIQRKGGRAYSAGIVDHFKDKIPSKDLPLFKSLLKEIAILEKSSSGSVWVLKSEHQQQ